MRRMLTSAKSWLVHSTPFQMYQPRSHRRGTRLPKRAGLRPAVWCPLKRVIQRVILNELSKEILSGKVSKDAVIEAVLEDGAVHFENVELPTV
jgi:hypothetical protein